MEMAFRALLTGSASVTALVPSSRISWGMLGQGLGLPAIVLTVVSDREGHTLEGPDGLSMGRVQVDCYGVTYASAKGVARAVRALLDGYRGGSFRAIFHDATRDFTDANATDRPHRVSLDFLTNWRQT